MAENTPGESELAKKVRYGVGLIRSSAEDFPHDPRAQIQLKVCEDVELVLDEQTERIEQLTKALESVDRQTPDAIGGASYEISPGALYKVRAALYGSGGPRPKVEGCEHLKEGEGNGES